MTRPTPAMPCSLYGPSSSEPRVEYFDDGCTDRCPRVQSYLFAGACPGRPERQESAGSPPYRDLQNYQRLLDRGHHRRTIACPPLPFS